MLSKKEREKIKAREEQELEQAIPSQVNDRAV